MEITEETRIREGRGSRRGAPDSRNRKTNIKVLAFLLLAVRCMVGAIAGIYLSHQRAAPVSQQGLTYETNAVPGDTPGRARERRQKELDNVVEGGVLAISMNITPFGKTIGADRSINWVIENSPNQGKLIRVGITCDDTREKILETGAVRPRNYLESGPLLAPLPAGEYDCTTVFLVYQEKTGALVGQAVVRIKLVSRE